MRTHKLIFTLELPALLRSSCKSAPKFSGRLIANYYVGVRPGGPAAQRTPPGRKIRKAWNRCNGNKQHYDMGRRFKAAFHTVTSETRGVLSIAQSANLTF